jgi:hypothetical protein
MPDPTDFEERVAEDSASDDLDYEDEFEGEAWLEEENETPLDEEEWMSGTRWRQTGFAAAGLGLGLLLGAGLALLFAPQSGEETRELLGERSRRLKSDAGDRLEDLRDELARVARRSRRGVRRGMTRGRWKTEDLIDRARW